MRQKITVSLFSLAIICLLLVIVYHFQNPRLIEKFSVHPLKWNQFYTAFTGVWMHADINHLFGNLVAFISLSVIFLLLFPSNWLHFFFTQYLVSSMLFFLIAKENTQHIGASVWVYAFVSFILTIVLLQPNRKLWGIFLVTILFYGSTWWGLLPIMPQISHEGHLSGFLAGIFIAFLFRNKYLKLLPEKKLPNWYHEESKDHNPYDSIRID